MRHARPDELDALEELLAEIRRIEGVRERSRGVFHLRGAAFLHFHSDPAGLFADLRSVPGPGGAWTRMRVSERNEQAACCVAARAAAKRERGTTG